MSAQNTADTPKKPTRRSRLTRAGVLVLVLAGLGWLAGWLVQRSLGTPAQELAVRAWLDEHLNADVSLLDEMVVRLNFVRDSRLVLYNTEIEHPNPVFPEKFARIGRVGAWAPPLAVAGLLPGRLDIRFRDLKLAFEQGENGEWSHDGIMRPLAAGDTPFPFPLPEVSEWLVTLEESSLNLRRRGYELSLNLEGEIRGRPESEYVAARFGKNDFAFGRADAETALAGAAGPATLAVNLADAGELPVPVAGRCELTVESLPVSTLPFFLQGIPMDEAPGVFNGVIRYDEHPHAAGALAMEGTLTDVPLGVFGLPRNAPFRLTWPIAPDGDGREAVMHIGPPGYGAFELAVKLDGKGGPRLLSMRGDVAALDAVPQFFTRYSRWPDWLSRAFPRVRWRTGSWRGFGWQGTNLELELSRSMAGLNLTGEGEMLGGRVRLSVAPDQPDAPITVAAERLDTGQLSSKLSQFLPDPFRAHIVGGHVNLTWRGFPSPEGTLEEWGTGMVWAKPVVDLSGCGRFWRVMTGVAGIVADALPGWGGGDPAELQAIARETSIPLDQLSIVSEKGGGGEMLVEFRAYGASFGQATGLAERRRDGAVEGEFRLAGASRLLEAVRRAQPELARALDFLANETPGLRISFRMEPGGELTFGHHFLDDAARIHRELTEAASGGELP